MESTISVSKGVFSFKNGYQKKQSKSKNQTSLFSKIFKQEKWYSTFKNNWDIFDNAIKTLNDKTYSTLMNDVVSYVNTFYHDSDDNMLRGVVPSATLLTGVNQPDHSSQFMALVRKIREEVTPCVAIVHSQDAPSVKHLIENIVWQFVQDVDDMMDVSMDLDDSLHKTKRIRKSHCTMQALKKWYKSKYSNNISKSPTKKKKYSKQEPLVVIIQDFEGFSSSVLQDLVMIMSAHVPELPVVFIFGVATSVSALHKSFPYHVSSKLLIKVFHSHSSMVYLNQVMEEIFLTHSSPFHLSGKAFELLTDVFLFYDFSVTGLIRSIKYCMMEHYYADNIKSLCCPKDQLENAISDLNSEDLEDIRRLPSFRPYLESQENRIKIKLFEDDDYFRSNLVKQLENLHDYLYSFYAVLRIFNVFLQDLPKNVFGKSVRELYTKCATDSITNQQEFKDCMQLLNFQSQTSIVENLKSCLKIMNKTLKLSSPTKPLSLSPSKNGMKDVNVKSVHGEELVKSIRVHFSIFLTQIKNASTESTILTENENVEHKTPTTPGNRFKLKEQLLKATRVDRVQSEFEMIRSRFFSYLEEVLSTALQPPSKQPYNEIMFFHDIGSVKKQIIGAPRGAVHTALSNPVQYLQCQCCHLPTIDSVSDTLPDVTLAYKLHRECGKHINLYDWLQAFAAILQPSEDDEEKRSVDPVIQLRFTRAVAELQFLGFIKSSKRKTDHVMRLTW